MEHNKVTSLLPQAYRIQSQNTLTLWPKPYHKKREPQGRPHLAAETLRR
jgi:hypothetical protein